MWWWQSVALGGAFSLGGSTPVEYFTCWASACVEEANATAAAPDAALRTCRLVHRVISISSSLKAASRPPLANQPRSICHVRPAIGRPPHSSFACQAPHRYGGTHS